MNLVDDLRKIVGNHGCVCMDTARYVGVEDKDSCSTCHNMLSEIANVVEKYYFPKPLFENGKPVNIDDEFVDNAGIHGYVHSITYSNLGYSIHDCSGGSNFYGYDERVYNSDIEVFDADGVPIHKGDIVYCINSDLESYMVKDVALDEKFVSGGAVVLNDKGAGWWDSGIVTHKKPLLDAKNKRICEGDTLYNIYTGDIITVDEVCDNCFRYNGFAYNPKCYTHNAPDTQEKLDEDIVKYADMISRLADNDTVDFGELLYDIEEFVRRQRKLCEKSKTS